MRIGYLSVMCLSVSCAATATNAWAGPVDSLAPLISKALASYPSILSRQAFKEAAASDLTVAKLKFLPTPSFATQRNNVQFDGATNSGQLPSTNISVSQPLFLDGGIIAGYYKADARLSAADFSLLEMREDVSKRLITAYAEWLKSWLKILAFEESLKSHESLVGLISRRYDQGVASKADKDLALSRLLQASADLDAQRSYELTALTTISELVGEPVLRSQLVERLAREVDLPKRKDAISKALANSVTVQRVKFEAEAFDQEAKEIRAQALPQLSIQAQRQIGNAYFPGAQGFNAVGLVVSYAPGAGISSIASAAAARSRATAAVSEIETKKRELNDRLNAEYNEFEFAMLKKENLRRSASLSGNIADSYDRQYLVGRKSWLELMNAVRERAQTKSQLADAEGILVGASRRLLVYIEGTQQFDFDGVQK